MFYSVDLLSERRRGKFAKCWLAATLSKMAFKRKFRSATINAINVVKTCEEIAKQIFVKSNRPSERASLYMAAQLMYGVTVIYGYQVDYSYKIMFTIRGHLLFPGILDGDGKGRRGIQSALEPVVPDPGNITINYDNVFPNADAITIRELQPLFEIPLEGHLDFGHMDTSGLGLPEMSMPDFQQLHSITGDFIAPLPEMESTLRYPAVEIPAPESAFEESVPQVEVPLTPSKRKRMEPAVETPSKRRRKRLEAEVEAVQKPAEERAAPITTLELEPLHDTLQGVPAKRRKVLRIDEKKVLSQQYLNKTFQNVHFQTKPQQGPIEIPLSTGKELFMMPSSHAKDWASYLMTNFEIPLLEPMGARDGVGGESREISGVRDVTAEKSAELSSDVGKKTLAVMGDSSDQTRIVEQASAHLVEHAEGEVPHVDVPVEPEAEHPIGQVVIEDADVSAIVEDADSHGGPQVESMEIDHVSVEKDDIRISAARASRTAKGEGEKTVDASSGLAVRFKRWSKIQLKIELENYWSRNNTVTFKELCPPDHNTKLDAADCLKLCIESHKDRRAFVFQKYPYGDIRIRKGVNVS